MTSLDLSNVTWGEFLIGDLFYKPTLKNKKINKKKDLSKIKSKEFNIPLVNAKFGNNGVMYYGREQDIDYIEMSIDIVSDGAVSTGQVYPQISKTGVLYNAYLIKYKQNISKNILLFLTQSIKSGIKNKYGYEYKATWSKVQNDKIKLPVTKDGSIDYEFMDKYVENMKEHYYKNRKETIEQNIKKKMEISEISDLTLTEEEIKTILKMKNNNIIWQEFLLGNLFNIDNWVYGKNHKWNTKYKNKVKNSLPVISGTTMNNGVNYYTKDRYTKDQYFENELTINTRGESGKVFYHKNGFLLANNVLVMNIPNLNENQKIFIGTSIQKKKYHGYSDFPTKEKLKNQTVKLPVTDDGSIDYEFMELYTKAMHKYIIKKEIIKNEQYMKHLKTLTYKGD